MKEKNSFYKYLKYIALLIIAGILKKTIVPDTEKFPEWVESYKWYILLLLAICLLVFDLYKSRKELKRLENIDKKNLEDEKVRLETELSEATKRNEKPPHVHKRFENIIKKQLKYVAIDYKPFFWIKNDAKKESPKGIGFELMSKIFEPFNVKLINETPSNGYSWVSIFEDFSKSRRNELDFIMTPMYETRSRLYDYDVIYSIPLFYSDIGVYVKETDNTKNLRLSFDEIGTFLINKREGSEQWKLEYLPGEISEIVGKKSMYGDFDRDHILRKLSKDDTWNYKYKDFTQKLNNVASDDKNTGDVIFMERFKAQSIIVEEDLKLVNILKENQLVYPVSFVIHKEETVLRNFINLRITELRLSGELQKVIKNNALQIDITDEKVIDKVFLQQYDFSFIDENFVEKRSRFSDRMRDEFELLDKVYGNYNSFQLGIVEIIQNFRKDENLNILEIGFGSGITTEIILNARSGQNDNFIAVDDDDFMKHQIEENKNVNPKKVKTEIIDAIKYLEQEEVGPFDLIVSGYTIHNFTKEQREKLYNLMFAKMSNNSIFINADKISPDDRNERIEGLKYRVNKYLNYLKANPDKFPLIEEWVTHYINDQRDEIVMKETETKEILSKIGFSDLDVIVPEGMEKKEMMAILTARKTN